MKMSDVDRILRRVLLVLAVSGIVAVAGCSKSGGGQQRGLFTGYVTDQTEEEVTDHSFAGTVRR